MNEQKREEIVVLGVSAAFILFWLVAVISGITVAIHFILKWW